MKENKNSQCLFALCSVFLLSLPAAFAANPPATNVPQAPPPASASVDTPNGNLPNSEADFFPGGILKVVNMEKENLSIVAGRSHLMRFVKNVNRISVSDPEILDFLILSPVEILLNAKKEGSANLIIWDYQDQIATFDINVTKDPSLLEHVLKTIDPSGHFEIYPSKDVFIIKGETSSVEKAKQIEKAANAFAEGSVSLVHVKDVKQILLQTRFIQIDRTQDFDFGLDIEHDRDNPRNNVLQRFQPGSTSSAAGSSGQFASSVANSTRTFATPTQLFDMFDRNASDVYQISIFQNKRSLEAFLKAIENKTIVKVIARPNLIAKDGEEASFLVGGEAAIVTSSQNGVSVTYKEFGTKLKFTPEIIGSDRIKLTIEPEVSALSSANGVTVSSSGGGTTSVPGFTTTKAKAVVELRSEESFMLGGLLQQKVSNVDTGVPFLRRIPVIGKLFQSMNHDWTDTELLILVTPKIMESEKEPILEGNEEHDILSKASKLEPNPVPEDHADAIETYIKEHKRAITQKMDDLEKKAEPKTNFISGRAAKKNLDDLEKELQWEKAKP